MVLLKSSLTDKKWLSYLSIFLEVRASLSLKIIILENSSLECTKVPKCTLPGFRHLRDLFTQAASLALSLWCDYLSGPVTSGLIMWLIWSLGEQSRSCEGHLPVAAFEQLADSPLPSAFFFLLPEEATDQIRTSLSTRIPVQWSRGWNWARLQLTWGRNTLSKLLEVTVVVWMKNVPNRLLYLNTHSSAGGCVWGGYGTSRR